MSSKKKDNPLANQLAKLDLDLPEKADKKGSNASESADSSKAAPKKDKAPRHHSKPAPPPQPEEEELSDEELFLRAYQEMDPAKIYEGKYRGDAGAPLPKAPSYEQADSSPSSQTDGPSKKADHPDDDDGRDQVRKVRDMAYFERMVGEVNPLDNRDKYHHSRVSRGIPDDDDDEELSDAASKLSTPLLPRQGEGLNQLPPLDQSQFELLKRYKKATRHSDAPEVHIRGNTREQALVSLARFMATHYRKNTAFIRIIHGRGLQSDGEPVLKPAVLAWLEGPGLKMITGYAPEMTRGGDYGSLIVELER